MLGRVTLEISPRQFSFRIFSRRNKRRLNKLKKSKNYMRKPKINS